MIVRTFGVVCGRKAGLTWAAADTGMFGGGIMGGGKGSAAVITDNKMRISYTFIVTIYNVYCMISQSTKSQYS